MPDLREVLQDTLLLNAARAPGAVLIELESAAALRPTRPQPRLNGPIDQPIWFWEYDTAASYTRVKQLEVWARSMAAMHPGDPDKAWMTVALEVNWHPVFVVASRDGGQVRLNLPLSAPYVVGSFFLAEGHNDASNDWWPLEADIDSSFLIVFAYDIANQPVGGIPAVVPPARLGDPDFMPPPGGVAADPDHHYVVVCLSLVCGKERADFEPAGVLGAGRVYPHSMILASKPLIEAEAGVTIVRPDQSGYYGNYRNEPAGFRIMAPPDVDPTVDALVVADTNEFHAVDLDGLVNLPYWDLIFDYFLTDVTTPLADATGTFYTPGQPVTVVDGSRRGERRFRRAAGLLDYSNFRRQLLAAAGANSQFLQALTGSLATIASHTAVEVLLSRPSVRLAVPQTLEYKAAHLLLFGGDLHPADFLTAGARPRRDVLKIDRQGVFDSVHLAPRMKAHTLTQPPLDDPIFALQSIRMAPFCEHDCLHTHWRWGRNWTDVRVRPVARNQRSLRGFAAATGPAAAKFAGVGMPYRTVGSPMTPLNQDIDLSFPNARSFAYAARITLHDSSLAAIQPGVWQPVFHHGSAYSLSIANRLLFGATATAIANPPGEVSELYWNMRYQATIDGPLERLDLSPSELRRVMIGAAPTSVHSTEEMLPVLAALPQLAPVRSLIEELGPHITARQVADNATAVRWTETDMNRWLGALLPSCHDSSPAGPHIATLRASWDAGDEARLREVRLDWQPAAPAVTHLTLPGYSASVGQDTRFSLILANPLDERSRIVLLATVSGGRSVQASSKFAWNRDGLRELQNPLPAEGQPVSITPFFVLRFDMIRDATLILVDTAYTPERLPDFFQQLPAALTPLDVADLESLRLPTILQPVGLRAGDVAAWLTINAQDFTLPLVLRDGQPDAQYIRFTGPNRLLPVSFDGTPTPVDLPLKLMIIGQEFEFRWPLRFDPKTFAFAIDHDEGLPFLSAEPTATNPNHLDLVWRFAGAPRDDGAYHFFTLATRNYHYQIQLARQASLELEYRRLSDEPLTFTTSDFAVTPKGTSLRARVTDRPVRLNGIDTRFRFTSGDFSIIEDAARDFTLMGSGPLPPALVGDSTVDVALQFAQQGSRVALVATTGSLRGSTRLDCRPTRFRFAIDGLGLRFVEERHYYLYFTLSGSAQFTPDAGDDADGPLALLALIKIDMLDCPLAGDTRVLGKYVDLLTPLPRLKPFSFLGCFEMELRALAFVPQAAEFGGDAAMRLSGQLKFAQGAGDVLDARIDLHNLLIGLPRPGEVFPRVQLKRLAVNVALGEAFRLAGVVEFVDEPTLTGFRGEGVLQIQGLPSIATAFAFMRVRRHESDQWLRAWFLYAELREVSFMIPVIQIYIREVGLGFGYRYTLASIKAADQIGSPRELLRALDALSRKQGDLARFEQWSVDPEDPGQDPRWTVVLRGMISQHSAAPTPLSYSSATEKALANLFLLDAIISFRSDLTFFMAVRGWMNTNYADYHDDVDGARTKPLFSGYVLLSPRQKRFLARLVNNPGVGPGRHPPLPDFVRSAIANSRFSATLLVEPGLIHFELGWPNMLGWSLDLDLLKVEINGGFIFRITPDMLVLGTSIIARGELNIDTKFDFGFVGVRIYTRARVAFGARQIGLFSFKDPLGGSAIYAAIGLEAQITFGIEAWLEVDLELTSFTLRFNFSLTINFSASLEQAYDLGTLIGIPALRGTGTVGVGICGHDLQLTVKLAVREAAVDRALRITKDVLKMGLEASEVEDLPGLRSLQARRRSAHADRREAGSPDPVTARYQDFVAAGDSMAGALGQEVVSFATPDYSVFVVRTPDADGHVYFVLFPAGEHQDDGDAAPRPESGFLPPPPNDDVDVASDFAITLPQADGVAIEQYVAAGAVGWRDVDDRQTSWNVNWDAAIVQPTRVVDPATGRDKTATPARLTLRRYLRAAYRTSPGDPRTLIGDPPPLPEKREVSDPRVHHPSEDSFESAVRGAFEQFSGAPFFKVDANLQYDRLLHEAFGTETTIYAPGGTLPEPDLPPDLRRANDDYRRARQQQQVSQLRGMIVHDLIANLREFSGLAPEQRDGFIERSIAFQCGLVFRCGRQRPAWLDGIVAADERPSITQRRRPTSTEADSDARPIRTFNIRATDFADRPPHFDRVRWYGDAATIGIAWDLRWDADERLAAATPAQRDPEHHLAHYRVIRRALSGNGERDVVYTVRPAAALHRRPPEEEEGEEANAVDVLYALKPRFQIVDHFEDCSRDDLAALPIQGRQYLYTITPIDVAGHAGRPLTLVAVRRPTTPPVVPLDAELMVTYRIDEATAAVPDDATDTVPAIVLPASIRVQWTEPPDRFRGAVVPERVVLIFRSEPTLPVGSYGVDSTVQTPPQKLLSSSNARPLATDIKIEVPIDLVDRHRVEDRQILMLRPADLATAGVLPSRSWQPAAWQVFIQMIGGNGVVSSLAPVALQLQFITPEDDIDAAGERRRPAVLEWLAAPVRLAVLPPEDGAARAGLAHVPMPVTPSFNGTLNGVAFCPHPSTLSAIGVRWNSAPHARREYPRDLTAGYRIAELDVDAHTTATFNDADALSRALRDIQDVRMLPADQLLLAPADTLSTSQWEAWYAADIGRPARPDGSRRAWYSWRDSYLEWPPAPPPASGRPAPALHPALADLVARLQQPDPGKPAEHTVSMQTQPPSSPSDLAALFAATPPRSDPYGWSILHRLGLSVTFTVHNRRGELVAGTELLGTLQRAIAAVREADPVAGALIARHLHVELLFQPGKALRLEEAPSGGHELLALIQVSLRPALRQDRAYLALALRPEFGATHSFTITGADEVTVLPSEDGTAVDGQAGQPLTVQLPAPPAVTPIYPVIRHRGTVEPEIAVLLGPAGIVDPDSFNLAFAGYLRYVPGAPPRIVLLQSIGPLGPDYVALLRNLLGGEIAAINAIVAFAGLERIEVTDDRTRGFTAPLAWLAARQALAATEYGRQWQLFARYAEASGSNDPKLPAGSRIVMPMTAGEIEKILPDFLSWSQRFFEATGPVDTVNRLAVSSTAGPWTATGYQRAQTPAFAAPDDSNRLSYVHVLEDRWAHAYRYYVQPYGRYDLLWRVVRQSPSLFDPPLEGATPPPIDVNPGAGGFDVVVPRRQAVAMPVILRSARLDEPATPARPPMPAPTWEVVVARHPEQALIERNTTLARQLAYRQMAFTLLRRFGGAFDAWRGAFPEELGELALLHDVHPRVPDAYPDTLDHLDPSRLDADAVRSLDLPDRLGGFQQGALVLQWAALPFFYEHRLLLVAQTDTTVSPINSVTQRDFEYRAPLPQAEVGAADGFRLPNVRVLRIPVRLLWDSLPDEAQRRWPHERPDPVDSEVPARKPAALPDFDVTYQLVDVFSGNVEVQHEIRFALNTRPKFAVRSLGDHFAVDHAELQRPAEPQGLFHFYLAIPEITRFSLITMRFWRGDPPWPDGGPPFGVVYEGRGVMVFRGALTFELRGFFARLITATGGGEPQTTQDLAALETMVQWWRRDEPISTMPAGGPNVAAVRFVQADEMTLVWDGDLDAADVAALNAVTADGAFEQAVQQLIARAQERSDDATAVSVIAARGLDRPLAALAPKITVHRDAADAFVGFTWTGALFDGDVTMLREWSAPTAAFASAIDTLVAGRDALSVDVPDLPQDVLESLPLPLPLRDAFIAVWEAHVVVEGAGFAWKGRLASDADLDALAQTAAALAVSPPPPAAAGLPAALDDILTGLQAPMDVDFDAAVPPRPAQADLGTLRERLLIGTVTMRYQGHMTPDDARLLIEALAEPVDQRAVRRLYERTLFSGPPDRTSKTRTKRGSAAPSAMQDWQAMPLPQ